MTRAAEGDAGSFALLVERHKDAAVRFAYSLLRDYDDANEAAQLAFVTIYRQRGKFGADSKFITWLFTNVRQRCMDLRRRTKPHQPLDEAVPVSDESASPLQSLIDAEEVETLQARVRQLPEHYQEALFLRFREALTVREVAAVMDKPEKTVEQYILRALNKLRS